MISAIRRDLIAGALMIVLGLCAVATARSYRLGELRNMGPGFFPTILGVLLILLGAAIIFVAWRARTKAQPAAAQRGKPEWRGWIAIISSVLAFIALGRFGGLLPASFAISFLSALGDRDNRWREAFLLALAVSAVSALIFWWALRLQFPLFGWNL
jgi:hypothetical protein